MRRAQALDLIVLFVIVFVAAIVSILMSKLLSKISSDATILPVESRAILSSSKLVTALDNGILLMLILGVLVIAGLSFFVRATPVGIVAFLFVGFVFLMFFSQFSTVYFKVASIFPEEAINFNFTNMIFSNFPKILMLAFFISLVAFFAKPIVFGGGT